MKIGKFDYIPSYEAVREQNKQDDTLNDRIAFPQIESLEDLMFFKDLPNVSQDIYAVEAKKVANNVGDATRVRKLTGMGEGGG